MFNAAMMKVILSALNICSRHHNLSRCTFSTKKNWPQVMSIKYLKKSILAAISSSEEINCLCNFGRGLYEEH